MGLFDFLFGFLFGGKQRRNVDVVPDRIWMTTEAKFAGIAKEAEERSDSESVAVLLVAHFSDVLAKLEEIAKERTGGVPFKAVLASSLDAQLAVRLNLDESATMEIIVGERHPLPSVDDRLEDFADELKCRCRFTHHVSLDDAVMKIFAGERIKSLMYQMGMQEDEAIQSAMVSGRIRKAQEKIEGRVLRGQTAESAAAWMEINCPELTNK